MAPPTPSFTRAMTAALIITLPAALFAVLLVPGMHWPDWSRWIILIGWFGFGALAGQHTLQKMAGDAAPRWESNFGADVELINGCERKRLSKRSDSPASYSQPTEYAVR